MAGITLEIDPTSEDAANANLVITDGTTYFLMEGYDDAPNPWDVMRQSSADTEGELVVQSRPTNRTVTVPLRVIGASASAVETTVYGLQQKVGKLVREGGTLKKTTPSGDTVVFDVVSAMIKTAADRGYVIGPRAMVDLAFECKPYARGPAVQLSDHVETSLPVARGVDTSVGGDVPAKINILIDEDQGADQWWIVWGLRSRYYDSATSAALFYEAEGRTAQGGSATAAGPTGASGAGSNVMRNTTLGTSYQSILSTQATGGGAHLSHIGNYRAFARVQVPTANAGQVSIAFEWSEGDFRRYTRNPETTFPGFWWGGAWRIVDLGQVHLTKAVAGTQRWEGRVLAKSTTAGDDIDVDWLMFVPIDEGSGEVTVTPRIQTPTVFGGRDEFDQTAGALSGKTAAAGGTWATVTGTGATDYTVQATDHVLERSATDGSRYAVLGATTYTDCLIQVDFSWDSLTATTRSSGLIARYVDASNHVQIQCPQTVVAGGTVVRFGLATVIAGTATLKAAAPFPVPIAAGTFYTLTVQIDAGGRYAVWLAQRGANAGTPVIVGQDTLLATGGTLASGKAGIYDFGTGTPPKRTYDNFWVATPAGDAAVFASQSLELRSDQVVREDSGGTLWQKPTSYEGDYPTVPPAGKEARSVEIIVKGSRCQPTVMPDTAIDDLSFRATVTPRYLQVPA